MDPATIVLTFLMLIGAAVFWETLKEFVCKVIETVLPNEYGKALSKFVRAVLGVVSKVLDMAEMVCKVLEYSGLVKELDSEMVEWSEVPSDVKSVIERKGEYIYRQSL